MPSILITVKYAVHSKQHLPNEAERKGNLVKTENLIEYVSEWI